MQRAFAPGHRERPAPKGVWSAAGAAVLLVALGAAILAVTGKLGGDRDTSAGPGPVPVAAAPAITARDCDKVASTRGRDRWAGTRRRPYRTVARLVRSLRPGRTGCVRAGTYAEDEVSLRAAGVRLAGFPGERPRLVGRMRVVASGIVVSGLRLDGRNARGLPSPTINASDVTFRNNDVTNPGLSSCFLLGSTAEVHRVAIERNRIHDCGNPSTPYDHGIYMQDTVGANVLGNWIYDNASRGIKVGPDADFSTIRGNVIDGNAIGVSFSGAGSDVSSGNVVEGNVIAYPRRWNNVQSYWPDGQEGEGNVVRGNCLFDEDDDGGGVGSEEGFVSVENVVTDPRYVDRSGKDFRMGRSGCSRVARISAPPLG